MIGSPNFVRFVYDGDDSEGGAAGPGPGPGTDRAALRRFYRPKVDCRSRPRLFRSSDYGTFLAERIPAGGLSPARKSSRRRTGRHQGGTAGDQSTRTITSPVTPSTTSATCARGELGGRGGGRAAVRHEHRGDQRCGGQGQLQARTLPRRRIAAPDQVSGADPSGRPHSLSGFLLLPSFPRRLRSSHLGIPVGNGSCVTVGGMQPLSPSPSRRHANKDRFSSDDDAPPVLGVSHLRAAHMSRERVAAGHQVGEIAPPGHKKCDEGGTVERAGAAGSFWARGFSNDGDLGCPVKSRDVLSAGQRGVCLLSGRHSVLTSRHRSSHGDCGDWVCHRGCRTGPQGSGRPLGGPAAVPYAGYGIWSDPSERIMVRHCSVRSSIAVSSSTP